MKCSELKKELKKAEKVVEFDAFVNALVRLTAGESTMLLDIAGGCWNVAGNSLPSNTPTTL